MKLFTIGPVQMYQHTLLEKSKQVPYFRTEEFSKFMYDTNRKLKKLIQTKASSQVIYLTASGTAAMEATVMNSFDESDKVLVIVGGSFGKRFSQICSIHNIEHKDIILDQGETLTLEHLVQYEAQGFTGFLVNLDETSTGQLYNIDLIKNFCIRNNLYLIVDAISTFLCDRFYMDDFAADAVIISSQKGLCLSPGLSVVVLNDRIVQNKILKNNVKSLYFDFKDYIYNMQNGQTPFTPAVGILYEMSDMLDVIEKKGLDNHLNEIEQRAVFFRKEISKLGLNIPKYPLSNAITPIILDQPIAKFVFDELKNNYGYVVNPSGGTQGAYQLRISHIGDLSKEDYIDLIEKISNILQKDRR